MTQTITYKQNPPISDLYKAFMDGFSDYMIQFQLDEPGFESVFLVRDQNQPSRSIVAYADGQPIGVVLSGIANLDSGFRTRCGGLAIAPEFRHLGIAKELMRRFEVQAEGVPLLEVIKGNDPALALYKRLGYEVVREIFYFQSIQTETSATFETEPIQTLFEEAYSTIGHVPIWQQDARVTQQPADVELVRVKEGEKEGLLLYRGNVLLDVFGEDDDAEWILQAAASRHPIQLTITSDRSSLLSAAKALGFKQGELSQYEMVKVSA